MSVRAPGKAMLFGEYAVLDGAPAIVAAIDRDARGRMGTAQPASAFVTEALAAARGFLAERGLEAPVGAPTVDSTALYAEGDAGRKLGLGSSAAVTVAAFGAVLEAADAPLDDRDAIFAACEEAHARAQGTRGSGADLAASIWGGVVRFLRPGPSFSPLVTPLRLAEGMELTLVDTGAPASTGERLARLEELRARDRARYVSVMRPLSELAAVVAGEVEVSGEIPSIAVTEWALALDGLAAAIDLPIVTERHRAVIEAARAVGGTAKPSGAGGGDLAVCFAPAGTRARLVELLSDRGLVSLDLRVGAPGLASSSASKESQP